MTTKNNEPASLTNLAISIFQRDIFILLLAILTGIIIARSLGPEILGVWILLSLVSNYAETFGRLKTDMAAIYIIGSGRAKPSHVFFATNFFALASSLTIVSLLFWQLDTAHDFFFSDLKDSYYTQLSCLILLIPFEFILINNLFFLLAIENVIHYNRIKVLRQIVHFVAVLFFLALGLELWSLVIARLLEVLLALIYSFFCLEIKGFLREKFWNHRINKEVLSYGLNFYSIGIIDHIQELSVKTISAVFLNISHVAFYGQGEGAGKILGKIPEALTTILYPKISRIEKPSEAIDLSCKAFRITLLILIIVGTILAVVAKPLVILLYGIAFELSAIVLSIVIPGIVVGSSCLTLKTFFEGSGQADLIPKVQTIPVILQVLTAYFLISSHGLFGAAVSFSLGFSLYGIAVLVKFVRVNEVSISNLIPRREDLRLLYTLTVERFLGRKFNNH